MSMCRKTKVNGAMRNMNVYVHQYECNDHHHSTPRRHVLSKNKKGEVCGFSSLNAVLGQSSSSKGSEFNRD